MEKRTIIAVVLSIAVFYLFSSWTGSQKQLEPVKPPSTVATQTATASLTSVPLQNLPEESKVQQSVPTAQEIIVDTDLYTAVFTPNGAALRSLVLKKYRESIASSSPLVVIGKLADPALPAFSTTSTGFTLPPQALYSSNLASFKLLNHDKKQLIFTYIAPQGFTVRKTYTLDGNNYGIQLETQLLNNSSSPLTGAFQQILTTKADIKENTGRYETYGTTVYAANGLNTDTPKDLASGSKKYDKSVQWAGVTDKYFLTALLAEKATIASVELKTNKAGFIETIASTPVFTVSPAQAVTVSQRIFVGPKEINTLKAQGSALEQSLDLGWFSALAKPMLHALNFFYGYVSNYGVAIIIITVILKIVFFPLTHKSYKSMKEMGNLQPKMAALKEKYKNDRDAMNRAVMELYREHKVNPLGGCLPMVVQIPVFFALYKALMFSIELRHAPFIFWVTDLSDKDPYYVTPIIMGATMFIQQKMTPSNMDEMQQKIMLALPIVFTFMFLNFPSGLVLYWLVNNILTIAQQMYINKLVNVK